MDRTVFNSLSMPPVPGPAYMDNIAEKIGVLFNSIALKPTAIVNAGNDYTLTIDPVLNGDVSAGMSFYIQPNVTNTGAVRVRVTAANPYYTVVKASAEALAAGDFNANTVYFVVFIAGQYRILSVAAADGGGGVAAYYQEFDVSGTWTKPLGLSANALIFVECWGGGGGGGSPANGGGGGGGAYNARYIKAGDLTSTVAVTVGAGGSIGGAGGNSSFGSLLTAYGGGGANIASGGGGGITSAGTSAVSSTSGVGGGPIFVATGLVAAGTRFGGSPNEDAIWGGGGGSGGNSVYGGGGGANTVGARGISIFGGNGGTNGVAGSSPGGGGGRNAVGAAGKVIIRVIG